MTIVAPCQEVYSGSRSVLQKIGERVHSSREEARSALVPRTDLVYAVDLCSEQDASCAAFSQWSGGAGLIRFLRDEPKTRPREWVVVHEYISEVNLLSLSLGLRKPYPC